MYLLLIAVLCAPTPTQTIEGATHKCLTWAESQRRRCR